MKTQAGVNLSLVWFSMAVSGLLAGSASAQLGLPLGTAITYQGRLVLDGAPVDSPGCDISFSLWNHPTDAFPLNQIGPTLDFDGQGGNPPPIAVNNGLFTIELDFGSGAFFDDVFSGNARWLEIAVACPSGGVLTTLSPRQPLTAAPFALQTRGLSVDDNRRLGVGTLASSQGQLSVRSNAERAGFFMREDDSASGVREVLDITALVTGFTAPLPGLGSRLTWRLEAPNGGMAQAGHIDVVWDDPDATRTHMRFGTANGTASAEHMRITPDGQVGIGTNAPTQQLHVDGNLRVDGWIGTDVDAPVEVLVNGIRALRIEHAGEVNDQPNLIAGSPSNLVDPGVVGSVIAGGGSVSANRITDHFGVIGGGLGNRTGSDDGDALNSRWATVGGGQFNLASGEESTVSGGHDNTAGGDSSSVGGGGSNSADGAGATVAGGSNNTAGGSSSTVAGGSSNAAIGQTSTVGGGAFNTASGLQSTVPGGIGNTAGGDYSFAAGRQATADHAGTFVWSDSSQSAFASTAADQFLIGAAGGVGINKTNPVAGALDVDGDGFFSGSVGIGTTTPAADLHVRGADVLGSVLITPSVANSNSQIFMAEQQATSFGMILRYDGGANQLQVIAQQSGVETDPLMIVQRSSAGRVGLGTTSPNEKLHVVGNIRASGSIFASCGTLTCSDARFKTNVRPVERALAVVERLRPVRFDWKRLQFPDQHFPNDRQIGLIAQEVQKVAPEVVQKGSDGYLAVDYARLTPLLVEAMKEMQADKDARIAEQQKTIENLAARLQRLEGVMAGLLDEETGGAE